MWEASERHLIGIWERLRGIWEASERHLGGIWEASGRHLGGIREASWRHLGGIWEASGTPGGYGAPGGSESQKSMPLSAKYSFLFYETFFKVRSPLVQVV